MSCINIRKELDGRCNRFVEYVRVLRCTNNAAHPLLYIQFKISAITIDAFFVNAPSEHTIVHDEVYFVLNPCVSITF